MGYRDVAAQLMASMPFACAFIVIINQLFLSCVLHLVSELAVFA